MFDRSVFGPVVLPHAVKIAVFLFLSAGLAGLLNGLAALNLSPFMLLLVTGVINELLAIIKKWYDATQGVV